jgi:ABC-type nitrate/sulfonate/bicarbonate transport system ATPase subunit
VEAGASRGARSAISIRGVEKRFGDVGVFGSLNLEIGENEFVSILGPSGCGKTTLLRVVAGLTPASAGLVEVNGAPVTAPRRETAVIFQNFRLLPWRTVEDNVGYGLRLRGVGKAQAREMAQPYIRMIGLAGREKRYPAQLSGGMQQRVALARALAVKPQILLMDEPFGALDAHTREIMQSELLKIWSADRKTVIFVTHSIDEAIVLSDRVVLMQANPGRIAEEFRIPWPRPRDPAAIRTEPEFVRLRQRMWELLRHADPSRSDDADG